MKERVITGVTAGAVFLVILYIGGLWFGSIIFLLALVALFELLRMIRLSPFSLPGLIGFLGLGLLFYQLLSTNQNELPFLSFTESSSAPIVILSFLLLVLTVVFKNKFNMEQAGIILIGIIYIGYGFYYVVETRSSYGVSVILFILVVIWSTDTGAYLTGRRWGKRKFWPSISPNKTWAGFVGGLIYAVLLGLIFQFIWEPWTHLWETIWLSLLIAIIGQLGDLAESAIKRHFQVKDSGTLLPGHGGVLDRFDSILFVFPLLYILQIL